MTNTVCTDKKRAVVYFNEPGVGSMTVVENKDMVSDKLRRAIAAAKAEFERVYLRDVEVPK